MNAPGHMETAGLSPAIGLRDLLGIRHAGFEDGNPVLEMTIRPEHETRSTH